MLDKTWKKVEAIEINDKVYTLNGRGHRIIGINKPELSPFRHIIKLKWQDRILYSSDDHDFWCKNNGKEGWGTYNYNWWLHEAEASSTIDVPATPLLRHIPQTLATIDGWQATTIEYVPSNPKELLYGFYLDGGAGFIADGFVVISDNCKKEEIEGVEWSGVK
jgi:hypothetical protein